MAVTLINHGFHSISAILARMSTRYLTGPMTGLLCTKGKIPAILTGTLVVTSCSSTVFVTTKHVNLGLLDIRTLQDLFPFTNSTNLLTTGLLMVTIVISGLIFFLYTQLDQTYAATGDSHDMAKGFGINIGRMEVVGLAVSSGLTTLSGALTSQQDGYADASKGISAIIIGLANIIIREVSYSTGLTFLERPIAIIIGSILC